MTTETHAADLANHLGLLLAKVRRDAPELSGKLIGNCQAALDAYLNQGKPVMWQYRLRIRGQSDPWSQWHECSEAAYGDYLRCNHEQWEYEARALCVAP